MNDTPTRKPSADYIAAQNQLKQKLESAERGTTNVREYLEERFKIEFGLFRRRETVFDEQCINHLRKFLPDFIDHSRGYLMTKHPGLTLILSQPYVRVDASVEDMIDAVGPLGIQTIDLSEWSFHYPGKTSAIGFIVSRKSLKTMKMALESDQETKGYWQNFW